MAGDETDAEPDRQRSEMALRLGYGAFAHPRIDQHLRPQQFDQP
jgi:hypothetical protein